MTVTASPSSATSSLLVFGPQPLSHNADAFRTLHAAALQHGHKEWIRSTIDGLPSCWERLVSEFPQYQVVEGARVLACLRDWIETGDLKLESSRIPNIILSPLLVITHLCEYLDRSKVQSTEVPAASTEILGFCMGLLSALTVSVSHDSQEIERYGSTAVRLAMVIGAIVDGQDLLDDNGPSKSLATAWNTSEDAEEMKGIMSRFPEAYTSVSYDERRATITTAEKTAAALQQELRQAGIIANEIGLYGRFHYTGYAESIDRFVEFCDSDTGLQLPNASALVYPSRPNTGGEGFPETGGLHGHALRAILLQHSSWYQTVQSVVQPKLREQSLAITAFGPERCVPPSIAREIELTANGKPARSLPDPRKPDDIAVVGMSIRVAGADDVSEFWRLICEGKSQHREVPTDRIPMHHQKWRELDPKRRYFGNFMNDVDAFDHRFFKKSAREVLSTDPQQRILLQVAYQALEQAGYFNSPNPEKKVGTYIGVCASDYENNMACYQPNAFTATGNLKGFIAGKISHYFGWTGTGMVIDTACSSSMVAIHLACRAILSGECNAAIAGGVNVMTNPIWFQNLAAASFLSPTGQCKAFDASADGYCRGEGIAVVYLKRMSAALADGDLVLGSISGTAVNQNKNCTPIFVPNAPSLSDLFREVLDTSQIEPSQVSVVEAHGTGTQVGDPAEFDSIRQVLGGANATRTNPLAIGSIKGLVGHTECVSGVVSLIKAVLMIQNGIIPRQPSFEVPNPHLHMTPQDQMEIPTQSRKWDDQFRAALINNYGASGSNASAVVTQAPSTRPGTGAPKWPTNVEFPIRLCGKDDRSVREYSTKLLGWLREAKQQASNDHLTMADVAFNIVRQSNPTLDHAMIFSCSSTDQLLERLTAIERGDIDVAKVAKPAARPVILCFGGQISTFVGLNRQLYDNAVILQQYLDRCDNIICRSLGCESIFPEIFEKNPISDPVRVQTMLFAMQYSCAMCWIDCGVQPTAVVGHSFGELVALCVSGVLSLEDALKMVAGRAGVIKECWGDDKGSMVATEADLQDVQRLLKEVTAPCEEAGEMVPAIACFNGPRSFTLAGPSRSIDIAIDAMTNNAFCSSMRFKKLNVTNAFHSTLVEGFMSELETIGQQLNFQEPTIHLERSIESPSTDKITARYVADHMRNPVYFNHAVRRLAEKYPSAVWLEAGSNSTITNMASRALQSSLKSGPHFQPINITTDNNAMQQLINATTALWKEGLAMTSFWAHHRLQTYDYSPLVLPGYQFEASRSWMDYTEPRLPSGPDWASKTKGEPEEPKGLWTFMGYQDDSKQSARFRINTTTEKYMHYVSGHLIAQTAPICPATLVVDMVVEALRSLAPEDRITANMLPQILDVDNQSPICVDPSKSLWLDVHAADAESRSWGWKILSEGTGSSKTSHVTGRVLFVPADETEGRLDFSRYERLVSHKRCVRLLNDPDVEDVIQGRNIYHTFKDVVDYSKQYQGLQKLVGTGTESAGRVNKKHTGETWMDCLLSDAFSQVGGIWVNCMTDKDPADMYIATGFEKWMRSPDLVADYPRPATWDVFGNHHQASDQLYLSDLFIFDATNGKLLETILGIHYHKIPKASMSNILTRLTPSLRDSASKAKAAQKSQDMSASGTDAETSGAGTSGGAKKETSGPKRENSGHSAGAEVTNKVGVLLAEISGLERSEIQADSQLADIGIDSLMGMELARELEGMFECTLPSEELMNVADFGSLVLLIQATLGITDSDDSGGESETSSSAASTPETSTSVSDVEEDDGKALTAGPMVPLQLPSSIIISAFEESRKLTDKFITDYHCAGYMNTVLPKQTQLCVALTVEAFERMGFPLRTATPGQQLEPIKYAPQHRRLMDYLYHMLEVEARLIDRKGDRIIRTAIAAPSKSSAVLLENLLRDYPDHEWANKLVFFASSKLHEVIPGECDGIKLIFGTDEGRELVTGLYGDSLLNKLANVQMQDILTRLISKLSPLQGVLKIMELGAGTGGTTKGMAALLSKLNIPVEYTFTDISGSFVAAARKEFKHYPFMKFRVHDIEKAPAADLVGTQHVIIASNAIHATHSLTQSTANIRKALRPDGFLMMLEMTEPVYWVDLIFGLFEGWWLFEDGRQHAIAHQTVWERDLHSVGYGHVDWTDGHSPEMNIQRILVALASGPQYERQALEPAPKTTPATTPTAALKSEVDGYVRKYTEGFEVPSAEASASDSSETSEEVVLITGATGSLGAHLVKHIADLPQVTSVICVNRRSAKPAEARQQRSMEEKGILLDANCQSKLQVLQTDTSKPALGLPQSEYNHLVKTVTHVIHNAWPMTGKRPLSGMESQFQVIRNLVDFARDISIQRPQGFKVRFQFISSIAVVGHYPLHSGQVVAPEERMAIDSVLPNGYGYAKYTCEQILDKTLHQYPDRFDVMAVRLGQIAGSKISGYWNPMEHLSFLLKSSQTLKAIPDFEGDLCWTPVDDVAGTLSDLLLSDRTPYPIYHIDNPVRQPWREMIPVLCSALQIPSSNVIPFIDWVQRVRSFPGSVEWDNPAALLIDFLDEAFLRMSCGGLLLGTTKSCEHSPTLAAVGPVSAEVARKYIQSWKDMGFLHS